MSHTGNNVFMVLSFQAKFIAPANYKDVIEERSIAKLCGYPICSSKLGKVGPFRPACTLLAARNTSVAHILTFSVCF